MTEAAKSIAVVQRAPTAVIQDLFRRFVAEVSPPAAVAGVVETPDADGDACGAGELKSLRSDARYPIFQDLGPGASGCRLDATGLIAACADLQADIAHGCDLLVVSKFGKLESERSGLISAFSSAIDAGVPILTSVSPKFADHWAAFAAPLFVVLPPEEAALRAWWKGLAARAYPAGAMSGLPVSTT
jgi:hypothetical protein